MPETYTLVGLGITGVVIAWLIFSVFKKLLALLLFAGLALGAWIVWQNPQVLQQFGQVAGLR